MWYRQTTDTTNTERARQQGPRALAAALKIIIIIIIIINEKIQQNTTRTSCRVLSLTDCKYSLNLLIQTRIE